ncbi:hypothetical protein GCM10008959_34120 [Deinococcus seoulensis]|uniref:Rhodanese domain-containing protein n=2 Tax=Deinococcus TaxID=1298 RepID=A0ABQ2RYI6_9DEIO|nr:MULTISPECIES: rhodanese-like domain-containing protein [Deinococcus]GGR69268.1 hypothetical protein GCM10008959_34120 [Deinococcus seoulensis]GGS37404.1 hypothetical protein GCM10008961_31220 [Deinococcus knuensis]
MTDHGLTYQDLYTAELEPALRRGAQLIDVREPDEYVQGHIPGALNLPLSELSARHAEISGPAVIVCLSGGRSAQAASFLAAQGRDVHNLVGGTAGWMREGRPLTSGPHP